MNVEEAAGESKRSPAGLIKPRPSADTEWAMLKSYVCGDPNRQLTELEKRLLTNDSEDLALDPLSPTYPATKDAGGMVGQEPPIAGAVYHNTTMGSMYKDGDPAAALKEADSK